MIQKPRIRIFYKEEITMSKRSGKGGNPNWPSKTGKPSGGGRGNNPPSKK
jgi:hypothetical protein